jgi:hypothetical protein
VNQAAKRHKKVTIDDDSDDEISFSGFVEAENGKGNYMEQLRNSVNDSSEESIPYSLFPFHIPEPRPTKRSKHDHYTAEIIVEVTNRDGQLVPINALLDTGTSSTIVLRHFVKKNAVTSEPHRLQEWHTLGGKFYTKREALIDFRFPELDTTKTVTWSCHIDENTKIAKQRKQGKNASLMPTTQK